MSHDQIRALLSRREQLSNRVIHGANYVTHSISALREQENINIMLREIAEQLPKLGYRDRFTKPSTLEEQYHD